MPLSEQFEVEEENISSEFEVEVLSTRALPPGVPTAEEEEISPTNFVENAVIAAATAGTAPVGAKAFSGISTFLSQLQGDELAELLPKHPILARFILPLLTAGSAVGLGSKFLPKAPLPGIIPKKGIAEKLPEPTQLDLPLKAQIRPAPVEPIQPRLPFTSPQLKTQLELLKEKISFGEPAKEQLKLFPPEQLELPLSGGGPPQVPLVKPPIRSSKQGVLLQSLLKDFDLSPTAPETQVATQATPEIGPIKYGPIKRVVEYFQPFSTLKNPQEVMLQRGKTQAAVGFRIPRFVENTTALLKKFPLEVRQNIFAAMDNPSLIKDLSPDARQITTQLRRNSLMIARDMETKGLLPEGTVDENKLSGYVHYMYTKHIIGDDRPVIMTKTGKLDLSETLARNPDLTPEQRIELGLIDDSAISIPVGFGKTLSDLKNFDYLTFLSNKKDITLDTPNEVIGQLGNIPSGYKVMPDTKSFGPLAGKVVQVSVYNDLTGIESLKLLYSAKNPIWGKLADLERTGTFAFKTLKVPMNLPTAFRNIVSNFIQMSMPKHGSLHNIPTDIKNSLVSMINKDALFIENQRNGAFRSNFITGELNDLLGQISGVQPGKIDHLMDVIANKSFIKYYGRIDDVTKHAIYVRLRNQGSSKEEAFYEAMKWGMDYSLAPKSIKEARTHALPFITYFYKIAPLTLETIQTKPWLVAGLSGVGLASQELAKYSEDMTSEEWKQLKSSLPEYIKNNKTFAVWPTKDKNGQFKWIEYNYFLPWGAWMDTLSDINQKDWDELKKDFPIFNPLVKLADNLSTILSKDSPIDPFTEREIYSPLDSPQEQIMKTMEFIYNQWSPKMLQRFGALGYTFGDRFDKWGRETTDAEAALKWLGVNITTTAPGQIKAGRESRLKDLNIDFNKIKKDPTLSPEKKKDAAERFAKQKKEIFRGKESQGMIQDLLTYIFEGGKKND